LFETIWVKVHLDLFVFKALSFRLIGELIFLMTERAGNIHRQKYERKIEQLIQRIAFINSLAPNFHLLSGVRKVKHYLNILLDSNLSNPSNLTVMTTINSTPSHQSSTISQKPNKLLDD
jgi:hypothetical protein